MSDGSLETLLRQAEQLEAERKFDEYGVDMPDEARKMIDAAREGEFPDPVKDL